MSYTNANRSKVSHKARLPYSEAMDRQVREKSNKQQRRKTRYSWE